MWAKTFRPSSGGRASTCSRCPPMGLSHDVLLVAVGSFASMALSVAERLRNQGIGVTVVDPRWVLPVPEMLARAGQGPQAGRHGGGQRRQRRRRLRGVGRAAACRDRRAVPRRRVCRRSSQAHASRSEVLAEIGLTEPERRPSDHGLGGGQFGRRIHVTERRLALRALDSARGTRSESCAAGANSTGSHRQCSRCHGRGARLGQKRVDRRAGVVDPAANPSTACAPTRA